MFEDKDARNELNKNIKCNKNISSNIISTDISDSRRASDGFYDMKDGKISMVNKRRYSDGFMQTIDRIDDSTLARRRKTLKRQTTINDTDAANYCNLNFCKSDMAQCKGLEYNLNEDLCDIYKRKNIFTKSIRNIDEKTGFKNGTKNFDVYKKCVQKLSGSTHRSEDDSLNKKKQECNKEKNEYIDEIQFVEQVCVDKEETTCCCRSGTKKYWKKMEKIIQENKNLTKSRNEMVEIQEMLSSVLSVRLEPGF